MIAEDTPTGFKAALGGDWIDVVVREPTTPRRRRGAAGRIAGVEPEIDPEARRVSAPVADRMGALSAVVRELGDAAEDIALRRPTLDEVFLHLTDERRVATMTHALRRLRRRLDDHAARAAALGARSRAARSSGCCSRS